MFHFEEELVKFQPATEVSHIEEDIKNEEIKDLIDIIEAMLKRNQE